MISKRSRPSSPAIVGSAAEVAIGTPDVLRYNVTQHWQREAWDLYDMLPDIHYPANFIGSNLSRFILRVGQKDPKNPTDPPDPAPNVRSNAFEMATAGLADLDSGAGGHKEMLKRWGLNATVAADCWLLGTDNPDTTTTYEVLSVLEITITPTGDVFRNSWGTGQKPEKLVPGRHSLKRLWRAHPGRSNLADSAMQPLIGDCRRLVALNDSITSRLLSRLSQAGILGLPNSLTIPAGIDTPDGTNRGSIDNFVYYLLNHWEKSMLRRGTAADVMPIPVRGPDDAIDKIKHITLDRKIDDVEMKLRSELRAAIARGLDLPPEVQTGLDDATHWQAWGVQDASFRSHLQPLAENLTDMLTRVYLHPYLRFLDIDQPDIDNLVIFADGSQVVTRPNDAEDKRQMHDRMVVSDAAVRRASAVSEDDAPDDDEMVRMVGRKINNSFLALWGLDVHDKIPWELVGLGAQRPGNVAPYEGLPGAGGGDDASQPIGKAVAPTVPQGGPSGPVGGTGSQAKPGVSSVAPSRRPVDNGTSTTNSPGATAGAPRPTMAAGKLHEALGAMMVIDPDTELDLGELLLALGVTFDDED